MGDDRLMNTKDNTRTGQQLSIILKNADDLRLRIRAARTIAMIGVGFIEQASSKGKVCDTCCYLRTTNDKLTEIDELSEKLSMKIQNFLQM